MTAHTLKHAGHLVFDNVGFGILKEAGEILKSAWSTVRNFPEKFKAAQVAIASIGGAGTDGDHNEGAGTKVCSRYQIMVNGKCVGGTVITRLQGQSLGALNTANEDLNIDMNAGAFLNGGGSDLDAAQKNLLITALSKVNATYKLILENAINYYSVQDSLNDQQTDKYHLCMYLMSQLDPPMHKNTLQASQPPITNP